MKKLFISVLALAGLAACYNENVVSESSSLAPITFGDVFVENATRADDPSTKTENINAFYVWAVMDSQDGTVFADERIHKSGDSWIYDQTATWAPGHTYYFAAIAAEREEDAPEFTNLDIDFASVDVTPEGMTPEGLGTITFTNTDGTDDILYAEYEYTTENPMTSAPEAVKFQFHHLLSKIKFTFINGFENENDTVVVTNVKIEVPEAGTIDLTQDSYTWTPGSDKLALDMGHVKNGENLQINERVSTNERFTIPASADMTYKVTFDVETFAGNVRRTSATKTIELKGYEFGVGNAYNLVATINKDNADENPMYDIVFNVEVDEWAEQEDEQLTFYDPETNTATIDSIKDLEYINESIYNQTIPSDVKIILSNDIDLNDYYNITRSSEPTTNWTPIGTSKDEPFTGTLDGNGHKIKNFRYVVTGDDEAWYVGFFGYAKNATIKNVIMENVTISSEKAYFAEVGAVVGHLEGTSTLENITITGDVKIEGNVNNVEASRIGAVVGGNANGTITVKNVHVNANAGSYVKGGSHIGGIAGQLMVTNIFENCSTNIDVTAGRFFAGGIIGCAGQADVYTNCHSTGNIAVVAGRANNDNDIHRVGGIAGGWNDGETKVCTLVKCSYAGEISGKDANDTVAEAFDCCGLVGRGYSTKVGAQVVIDSDVYTYAGNGVYTINGCTPSASAEEVLNNLKDGGSVYLTGDVTTSSILKVNGGGVLDGNGNTLTANGVDAYESFVAVCEGTLKNVTVKGAYRALGTGGSGSYPMTGDAYFYDVITEGATYGFNISNGNGHWIYVDNCVIGDWNSYSGLGGAHFTNCTFIAQGNYKAAQRIYGNVEFTYENCTFPVSDPYDNTKYYLKGESGKPNLIFKNCKMSDGTLITEENITTYFKGGSFTYDIIND